MVSWRLGQRDLSTAYDFTHDLADRLRNRVQLTTDGHKVCLEAIENAFGADVDYAVLQKVYGADQQDERRYSPATILNSHLEVIKGNPDPKHISTSYVERHNWRIGVAPHAATSASLTLGMGKIVASLSLC